MISITLFYLSILGTTTSSRGFDCAQCYYHLKVEVVLNDQKKKILFVSVKPKMDNHESVWINQDGSVGFNTSLKEILFYKDLSTVVDEKEYGNKGYCAKRKDVVTIAVKKINSLKLIEGMRETYGPVSICK